MDLVIHNDVNVLKTETEKRLKYKDLQIEISRMSNVKTKVVAVVVVALGTTSDNFNKEIESIPGKPSAEGIQNIALKIYKTLNGTAHVLRKVLGRLIGEHRQHRVVPCDMDHLKSWWKQIAAGDRKHSARH